MYIVYVKIIQKKSKKLHFKQSDLYWFVWIDTETIMQSYKKSYSHREWTKSKIASYISPSFLSKSKWQIIKSFCF